jgi:putative membrane protein
VAALIAALLWFWHSPAPYDATFSSAFVYWSMHISLFASAMWL